MELTKVFEPSGNNLTGFVRNYVETNNSLLKFIASSSLSSQGYGFENLFDYSNVYKHWASELKDGLNSFLKIKVCKFGLVLSHFSIRSHYQNNFTMRSWVFEASNDGKHYDVLVKRDNSNELNDNAIKLYDVNPMNKVYSVFRIRQTNPTLVNSKNMRISKIDLFGVLVTMARNTCNHNNAYNRFILNRIIMFIHFTVNKYV